MTQAEREDKLPPTEDLEENNYMPAEVRCPDCTQHIIENRGWPSTDPRIIVRCVRGDGEHGQHLELKGIVTCTVHGHRRPIKLVNDSIDETAPNMPIEESRKLRDVPKGIVEDVQEAERAHFAQCYKAVAVMCRRAIQLALEDKTKSTGKTLGPLLDEARQRTPLLLKAEGDSLAERVHHLGDAGAHKTVTLDPKGVEVAIFDTVVVLNELYAKPA